MLRPYRQFWRGMAAGTLEPGDILIAEYNYVAQTAFQSNEDRARVASFYLVSFSSFIAAILTYQFNISLTRQELVNWGFAVLFLALTGMGLLTLLQLARLRVAWFESVRAMNQIKEYYIAHNKGLEKAFAWRNTSAPTKFKFNSVGFMLVVQVAMLGSTSLGTAVFFAVLAINGLFSLLPAFGTGIAFFFIQVWVYRQAIGK
jgi:hypothetical protein